MKFLIIEKILDKILLSNKRVQGYINERFNKPGFQVVQETLFTHILKDTYYKHGGFNYIICDELNSIEQVETEYDLSDIRKTDVVLDIGACIGGFTLPVSMKCKHVYAIEPIFNNILQKNVELNNINNVTVMNIGLGKPDDLAFFGNIKKNIQMYSLDQIIDLCGGHIDFLKIDCEGGEWSILPSSLKNIRRIEAEIHHFTERGMPDISVFENLLKEANFDYRIEKRNNRMNGVHAKKR